MKKFVIIASILAIIVDKIDTKVQDKNNILSHKPCKTRDKSIKTAYSIDNRLLKVYNNTDFEK